MSSPWFLSGIIGAALLLLCGIAYLVGAGFRTLNLATCWRCGAAKVRRSVSRSWLDTVAMVFLLKPYRCAGCRTRFYGFRAFSRDRSLPMASNAAVSSGPAVTAPPRKRAFPVRVKVIVRLPLPTTWQSAWELLLAEEEGLKPRNESAPSAGRRALSTRPA
jgi:hypothetical protein